MTVWKFVHALPPAPVPFGSSVSAIYTCCELRPLSQIHISSSYQLPSAHPVMATRRMRPSRFASRSSLKEDALLHCQRRSLFSLLGLLNSINSLIQTLDNSSCNLTSQNTSRKHSRLTQYLLAAKFDRLRAALGHGMTS